MAEDKAPEGYVVAGWVNEQFSVEDIENGVATYLANEDELDFLFDEIFAAIAGDADSPIHKALGGLVDNIATHYAEAHGFNPTKENGQVLSRTAQNAFFVGLIAGITVAGTKVANLEQKTKGKGH